MSEKWDKRAVAVAKCTIVTMALLVVACDASVVGNSGAEHGDAAAFTTG
jgi:hypothetical protein